MRPLLVSLCLCSLAAAGCGSSDKDTLTTKCEASCKLDPSSPCAAKQSTCISECRSLAGQAATQFSSSCGECVAEHATYLIKTSCTTDCCQGMQYKAPGDKECQSSCYEDAR